MSATLLQARVYVPVQNIVQFNQAAWIILCKHFSKGSWEENLIDIMSKRAANFRWMNLLHEALGSWWGETSSAQFIFLCCHQTWIPATPILCNQSMTECSQKIVDLCASGHIPEAWRKWSLWLPRPNLLREFHHLCHLWNFSQHMVEISSKHTGCSLKHKLVLIPTKNSL